MLKFFRTIRKKLIEEDNVRKYLLYAIGEILLVVIGILIALQINNWNEERINRNNEQFYLDKIELSLRADSAQLANVLNIGTELISQLDSSAIMLQDPGAYSDERFRANITALFFVNEFTPNRSVFDNLNATGEIKILQNQEFVDDLYNYYNTNTEIGVKEYSRSVFTPYMLTYDEINFENYRRIIPFDLGWLDEINYEGKSIQNYADDPFFLNSVRVKRFQLFFQNLSYQQLLAFVEESIQMLSEE